MIAIRSYKVNGIMYFGIEATSLSALFTFLIERTIIPFATENFQCKISAIYMIAIFIALPVITFIVLFKKKEWNYNVD